MYNKRIYNKRKGKEGGLKTKTELINKVLFPVPS